MQGLREGVAGIHFGVIENHLNEMRRIEDLLSGKFSHLLANHVEIDRYVKFEFFAFWHGFEVINIYLQSIGNRLAACSIATERIGEISV